MIKIIELALPFSQIVHCEQLHIGGVLICKPRCSTKCLMKMVNLRALTRISTTFFCCVCCRWRSLRYGKRCGSGLIFCSRRGSCSFSWSRRRSWCYRSRCGSGCAWLSGTGYNAGSSRWCAWTIRFTRFPFAIQVASHHHICICVWAPVYKLVALLSGSKIIKVGRWCTFHN